jgi:hypothetical protein
MSGWIKIHRSITEHWLYKEKRVFSKFEAWNDVLLTVNFTESKTIIKGKLYVIKRGECILSLDSWGKRWSWDKTKVRRFLNLLEKDSMIELFSDNITTHIKVCKYEQYQEKDNANETQTKRKRNSNEIQTQPIEEGKERKENNIDTTTLFDCEKLFLAKTANLWNKNFAKKEAEKFYNFYASKGWKVGNEKMKSLTHAIGGWISRLDKPDLINKPKEKVIIW